MLGVAFKEWAAICRLLGSGRQTILLRKGGVAETGGEFRPEHDSFWLYPTYYHEDRQPGLRPGFESAGDRPPPGTVRLEHFVEVQAVQFVSDLDTAVRLEPLHGWTADVVRQRFSYRSPGVFVLAARAHRVASPVLVAELPQYAGCKSWVPLVEPVEENPSEPVLTEAEWREQRERLRRLLGS
jgi:hypothetical protein